MEKKSATLYSIYYIIICGAKRDVRENNNSIISLKLIFKNDLYTERGEVCRQLFSFCANRTNYAPYIGVYTIYFYMQVC